MIVSFDKDKFYKVGVSDQSIKGNYPDGFYYIVRCVDTLDKHSDRESGVVKILMVSHNNFTPWGNVGDIDRWGVSDDLHSVVEL